MVFENVPQVVKKGILIILAIFHPDKYDMLPIT